jgi:hypothetical protein
LSSLIKVFDDSVITILVSDNGIDLYIGIDKIEVNKLELFDGVVTAYIENINEEMIRKINTINKNKKLLILGQ